MCVSRVKTENCLPVPGSRTLTMQLRMPHFIGSAVIIIRTVIFSKQNTSYMASRECVSRFYGYCMSYCKIYVRLGKFMQGTHLLP